MTLSQWRWQAVARCWCRRRQFDQRRAVPDRCPRSLGRAKARNGARSSRGLTGTMADSSAINRYNVKLPTVVGLDNST